MSSHALWSENAGAHPAGARDPERPSSGLPGRPGLCAGGVLQPRAPLRKVLGVQPPYGAHAAVQRPERRGGAQRHRGARLHETHDLLGQRRRLQDPLAGQAHRRLHAELGHVLLTLGPRGVHALQRAPQRRRVHVAPRGDAQRNVVPAADAQVQRRGQRNLRVPAGPHVRRQIQAGAV